MERCEMAWGGQFKTVNPMALHLLVSVAGIIAYGSSKLYALCGRG